MGLDPKGLVTENVFLDTCVFINENDCSTAGRGLPGGRIDCQQIEAVPH